MAPIPTYQSAPLHADGVTPKTAEAESSPQAAPASNEVPQPTRTIAQPPQTSDPSAPPPPQPGAVPMPGPAPTAPHTRNPSAPMPGANPNYTLPSVTGTATVTTTTTSVVPPPPQLDMSAPLSNHAPSKSTSSATYTPQSARQRGSSTVPFTASPMARASMESEGRHSLEHPPGYVQNPYAADGTAADRARLHAAAETGGEEDIWSSMKNAAKEAGKYAQKVEKDAWEWIETKGFK